ncbi:hypothetical protein ACFWFZ_03940 [Streptomyces sp. NPDC060232]|uniref:hypothetical protein n=1 Tax=Streptomyces sp. NPDC060232 TaxID=3347079 RepID=UPI0036580D33
MFWLSGSKVSTLLQQIGRDERPVTHETLDELPASRVLAHLRSVMVATGALPARDERLVALEGWITAAVQGRTDPAERRILHGYASWHHLRRLRRRLGKEHTTHLHLDWLTGNGLTLSLTWSTPPDDWQDKEAHTHGHTAVVLRPDWTMVPSRSITPYDLAGPRVPAPRPDGRAAAYQLVTELGPDWDPRLTVRAAEELSDGRILATLGGVQLECWLPSGEREWAIPDKEGGREIAVAWDETSAWISLVRPERHNRPPQSVVRLSLADGAQVDQVAPSGYVSLSSAADGDPTLAPSRYWIRGIPVASRYPFHIRHAGQPYFLRKAGRRPAFKSWRSVGSHRRAGARTRSDRPAEPEEKNVRRLFPYSWVPGEEHYGGPGVEAADGSLIHAGRVCRQRRQPGDSFVVRRAASDGTPQWVFRTDYSATALDADATTAFIAYDDGEIVALGLDTGTVLWRHRLSLGNVSLIPTALTLTQAGRLLIGTHDGRILLCSTTT